MDPLTTMRAAMPLDASTFADAMLKRADTLRNPASIIPSSELKDLGTPALRAPSDASAGNFGDVLSNMVKEVNTKQAQSAEISRALMSGQNIPLHKAMIASEEASLSFQLMVEVRNKLLESYQELMRMQV
jgi:flagellar hook-basal body complex protein FliE